MFILRSHIWVTIQQLTTLGGATITECPWDCNICTRATYRKHTSDNSIKMVRSIIFYSRLDLKPTRSRSLNQYTETRGEAAKGRL